MQLRGANVTPEDVAALDQYCREFTGPFEKLVRRLRNELGIEVGGRSPKSTTSIVEKLRRESIRLSQMQDIAGCRHVCRGIREQDDVVARAADLFAGTRVIDRRNRPSHGYRAVHLLVPVEGYQIELQVRTELQQVWAQLSERLADRYGQGIKYGEGDDELLNMLTGTSLLMARLEESEISSGLERAELLATARDGILQVTREMLKRIDTPINGSVE